MTENVAAATVEFATDIFIWGASLWGPSDPATTVAERWGTTSHYWAEGALWDTMGRREGWVSGGAGDYGPLPLRWSLPWLVQWQMRMATLARGLTGRHEQAGSDETVD